MLTSSKKGLCGCGTCPTLDFKTTAERTDILQPISDAIKRLGSRKIRKNGTPSVFIIGSWSSQGSLPRLLLIKFNTFF